MKTSNKQNYKISAYATAQLLIINASLYAEEKGKEISRYRFSRQCLREISGWGRLTVNFLEELGAEFATLGWYFMNEVSDGDCAIMQTSKISIWPKLSKKRLVAAPELWTSDEDSIDAAYWAKFPPQDGALESE